MNGLLDGFLVGVVVLAGFGYAIYSLGPKSWRPRAAAKLKSPGACGGCDNCGSTAPAPRNEVPDGVPEGPDAAAGTEVRVPLAAIGKRR